MKLGRSEKWKRGSPCHILCADNWKTKWIEGTHCTCNGLKRETSFFKWVRFRNRIDYILRQSGCLCLIFTFFLLAKTQLVTSDWKLSFLWPRVGSDITCPPISLLGALGTALWSLLPNVGTRGRAPPPGLQWGLNGICSSWLCPTAPSVGRCPLKQEPLRVFFTMNRSFFFFN